MTYYSFRLGLILARILSRPVAYQVCTVLGYLFYIFNRPARRSVEINMRHALRPHLTPLRHRNAVRRVFINLTKDYYDLVLLGCSEPQEILELVEASGLERLREQHASGRGVLAVFFHTAGFNLAAQLALTEDLRACIVAEPLKLRRMRVLVNSLRSSLGVKLIPADRSGVRQIVRVLRSRGTVVLAGDRDVTGTGVPVRLFGACATLPAAAAALALRTHAAVVPVHICRLPDNRVSLRIGESIATEDTGDFDADVRRITQELAFAFERELRTHPHQWVMVQPAWTECPPDHVESDAREDFDVRLDPLSRAGRTH